MKDNKKRHLKIYWGWKIFDLVKNGLLQASSTKTLLECYFIGPIKQTAILDIKLLNSVPEYNFPFFFKYTHRKLTLLNYCVMKAIIMNSNIQFLNLK